ncbi:MAG: TonB-dependent receptor [Bacteroidota bacterium]
MLGRIISVATLALAVHTMCVAQPTQTIRGTVVDKASKQPLIGATLVVVNSSPVLGAVTDESGAFAIQKVPVGRAVVRATFVGYEPFESDEFIVSSAKVVVLNIELTEGIMLEGVELRAARMVSDPLNESAVISSRSFSVEETERISASVNDMGRMALSFPGVQKGQNDTENDVIIRGNSSFGVLWRLEGIDIPNPNHFARPGTSGGGITVFSAQLLSRSDFFSGGMPAEYGNALSGAFDVHFKKGNLERAEHRAKIGLLGLDFATEGPIKKGVASYVANYRYSTLGLLNKMGFNLVGERVSNEFQDFSFNVYAKSKNNKDHFTMFGLGGLSKEHYTPVADPAQRDPGVANEWEEKINSSDMGALGVTHSHTFNQKSYLHTVVALMSSKIGRADDTLDLSNVPYRYNHQRFLDTRISTAVSFNHRFSARHNFKVGLIAHQIFYDFDRLSRPRTSVSDVSLQNFLIRVNGGGTAQTFQSYAQETFTQGPLTAHVGAHWLLLQLNGRNAVDPRASVRYQIGTNQHISFATGQHSQMLPLPAYFFIQRDSLSPTDIRESQPNFHLPVIRSWHNLLSYVFSIRQNLKITTELYYQSLSRVPIAPQTNSTYWMLNSQDDYPNVATVSEGLGKNYGIDLVVEKSFSNSLYFLLTGLLFDSKFKTATGTWYNTRFNSRWSTTATAGKEFSLRKGRTLQIGGRVLYNGGFRYSPYDPVLSQQQGRYVEQAGSEWTGQVPSYFRTDVRFVYRFNSTKYAGQVSLDIQNLTSKANVNSVGYDPVANKTYFRTYDGVSFIPVLAVQFDF